MRQTLLKIRIKILKTCKNNFFYPMSSKYFEVLPANNPQIYCTFYYIFIPHVHIYYLSGNTVFVLQLAQYSSCGLRRPFFGADCHFQVRHLKFFERYQRFNRYIFVFHQSARFLNSLLITNLFDHNSDKISSEFMAEILNRQ